MSASSYSRVVNRKRLRTHSTTSSTAIAATTTHPGRIRAVAAAVRPAGAIAVAGWTAFSPSLLMLTWRFSVTVGCC